MITNAVGGLSYHFFPRFTNDTKTEDKVNEALSLDVTQCEIYLFIQDASTGAGMPDTSELYEYNDIQDVVTAYQSTLTTSFLDQTFRMTYDPKNSRRVMKKWPIDALEFTPTLSGTLAWAAVKITADDALTGDAILFLDGITGWAEDNTSILVDNKVVDTTKTSLLKDITISLRDTFEVVPDPVF